MNANRERAQRLLKNYLRYGVEAKGLRWDSDCNAEVDDIVDCIIDAVKELLYEEAFGGDDTLAPIPEGFASLSAGARVVQPAEALPGYIYHTNYLR